MDNEPTRTAVHRIVCRQDAKYCFCHQSMLSPVVTSGLHIWELGRKGEIGGAWSQVVLSQYYVLGDWFQQRQSWSCSDMVFLSHGTFDNFFHQTHSRFSHNMTPKNLNFLLRTPRDSVSVCGESVPVFSTTHSRVRSSVSDTLKITVQFHHISHTPIISSERQLSY